MRSPALFSRIVNARPTPTVSGPRPVRAPRGIKLNCGSWLTEAPYRMIQNNLDPEVAEHPDRLVVYGGIGKAARDWDAFDRILGVLRRLKDDETLLVQSGKPVGVFTTHADAPRVLIANSNLVPHWATWEHFHELDRRGLMMYGQMTAGSWIYIGSQGIVQGTYETFVEMGRQHYGGDLAGRWILTAGLGGMGGAQPLAATMAGASMLAIECQSDRINKRLETGYVDRRAETLDEALAIIDEATTSRKPVSVGLLGNAAELLPEMVQWNREFLGEVNGKLLDDPRVQISIKDVFHVIAGAPKAHYDAILLDVDNGPVALVKDGNARLYEERGLAEIMRVLKPRGRVAFWSASQDAAFAKRLVKAGLKVEAIGAKAYEQARRNSHTIFVADRPGHEPAPGKARSGRKS
jgi:hypothetical protein